MTASSAVNLGVGWRAEKSETRCWFVQISARGPVDDFLYGAHILSRSLATVLYNGDIPLTAINPSPFPSLVMSTIQKLDPLVTVPIFISIETPILFPIYADQSEKEYLKCDLCGRELRLKNRKNTQGFLSHRGSKGETELAVKGEEIYLACVATQRGE